MEVREEIAALVAVEGRVAGSDAERRAALHLCRRLEGMGREARVEGFAAWPAFHVTHALHALLAIAGSLVSVASPALGAALVLAAIVSTFGDATGMFFALRRLTGRRASQNVVSPEDGGKPGVLVLVAHYDAGRTGALFSRRLEERRAALAQRLRIPLTPFELLFWPVVVVFACCALRLLGLEGLLLTLVQFVPTVMLVLAVPLLLELAFGAPAPGANDNASGVATALRLAERFGGRLEHLDLWVLLTGAQEPFGLGMRTWAKAARGRLERERTMVLNLDELGAGTVRYTRREGLLLPIRSHVQLLKLCDELAEDSEEEARSIVSCSPTDACIARSAGLPAITVGCRNALDCTPEHHQPTDTEDRIDPAALERAFAFCSELIARLDGDLGPELHGRETVLSEAEDVA